MCASAAPLTFTAWLVILEEDGVYVKHDVLTARRRPAMENRVVSTAG